MNRPFPRWAALAAGLSLSALTAPAVSDSGALLDALVRKGILTDQEAEDIRADLVRDAAQPPALATGGSNYTTRLRISGRLQPQYVLLNTDVANVPDPASTHHFFLRRVYLTARADLGPDWNTTITYDFAGSLFDAAFLQWRRPTQTVDIGLRKVNLGYEERISSGSLKAIERSGVTRYFVEPNNGRRLGAGSYRVGLFTDGTEGNFFYGAAVTNPERAENFTIASNPGGAGTNKPAFWANGGYNHKMGEENLLVVGAGVGYLPDQGGRASTAPFGVGTGNNLTVVTVYSDLTMGSFNVAAEYLWADVDQGRSPTADANPWGFWIQPSYKFTETLEGVFRYSYLDSDGRGVALGDGVRSAPSSGTNNKLEELYAGGNWYIKGNDLKFQAGVVWGKAKDTISGAPASAETYGVRSQMQINF
jgi:phosphate-selective porin